MRTRCVLALFLAGALAGCASAPKSPDVSGYVRNALRQAGFRDISVTQDRRNGVVTLNGHVPTDEDKVRAGTVAQAAANGQVVANQIAVLPPGGERDARRVNADLDAAIEKNLDAAFIQEQLRQSVKFRVRNGVVTLTGEVDSTLQRAMAQRVAEAVPNVQQVVNQLHVKSPKNPSSG